MSRIRGLAAMKAPRCAGRATSRALLYPTPVWLALSVACSELSSVNPGKSLSSDLAQLYRRFWLLFLEGLRDRAL